MKARRSVTDSEEISEINISPLIDMVFILLIFFLVTTSFVSETGVDADRPQAVENRQPDDHAYQHVSGDPL